VEAETLFLRRERRLKVDLGELKDECNALSIFLESKLKAKVTSMGNKLVVHSELLSPNKLKRLVNKFVYHKNLNHLYWVGLEGDVVKVNKFKHSTNKEKQKKGITPSTIKHGW
jgi:hypothetical protein